MSEIKCPCGLTFGWDCNSHSDCFDRCPMEVMSKCAMALEEFYTQQDKDWENNNAKQIKK